MKVKITAFTTRQALLALALGLCACPPAKPPPAADEARTKVLEASGQCALSTALAFQTEAHALATAPTQAQWRRTMEAWQVVEQLQFGPTASSLTAGGQDLRDQIYSWPLVSRCAVDDVLASKGYEAGAAGLLVNRRGLAALEYLLFYSGDDVVCSVDAWAQVPAQERSARRQAYAAAVATELSTRADALVAAWNGGFVETLKTAGPGNATYPSAAAALNRVTDSLLLLESLVRERKLAEPLGLRGGCMGADCVALVESPYSKTAMVNVRANLEGFRKLFQGCGAQYAGQGFDDLLATRGATDLSQRMIAATQNAQTAAAMYEGTDLAAALQGDRSGPTSVVDALKSVTDLLKSEFVMAIDVALPATLEGDND